TQFRRMHVALERHLVGPIGQCPRRRKTQRRHGGMVEISPPFGHGHLLSKLVPPISHVNTSASAKGSGVFFMPRCLDSVRQSWSRGMKKTPDPLGSFVTIPF